MTTSSNIGRSIKIARSYRAEHPEEAPLHPLPALAVVAGEMS
jgi:hypothetical protein